MNQHRHGYTSHKDEKLAAYAQLATDCASRGSVSQTRINMSMSRDLMMLAGTFPFVARVYLADVRSRDEQVGDSGVI